MNTKIFFRKKKGTDLKYLAYEYLAYELSIERKKP